MVMLLAPGASSPHLLLNVRLDGLTTHRCGESGLEVMVSVTSIVVVAALLSSVMMVTGTSALYVPSLSAEKLTFNLNVSQPSRCRKPLSGLILSHDGMPVSS